MDSIGDVLNSLTFGLVSDWLTTLTLVFGGCCSNALTLEQLTSQNPHCGTLITFLQFLLISLHGLPKFVTFTPYPGLKPRQIPLPPYLVQVLLFYAISLLNNAAFAYKIPMPVHIIFRSGGLIVSMLMGWLLLKRRYRISQIFSVLMVTFGVILTTLSASKRPNSNVQNISETHSYGAGVLILSLALILSGFLGVVQDKTYSRYGKRLLADERTTASSGSAQTPKKKDNTEPWQESMFYLHFLSMPLFLLLRDDLASQFIALSAGPTYSFTLPSVISRLPEFGVTLMSGNLGMASSLAIPAAYIPLILNTVTQLFCVAGVHRLTSRVSSLTVTLVLVVRKAVSLIFSMMMFGSADGQGVDGMQKVMMWVGAGLVFAGTMSYSLASKKGPTRDSKKIKKD